MKLPERNITGIMPAPPIAPKRTPDWVLTKAEREVLEHLADAWNAYLGLEEQHPSDAHEFLTAIHAAQVQVMARPTQRVLHDERLHSGG
jgi:hypothetical protein